jgi:hypothetical protein
MRALKTLKKKCIPVSDLVKRDDYSKTIFRLIRRLLTVLFILQISITKAEDFDVQLTPSLYAGGL